MKIKTYIYERNINKNRYGLKNKQSMKNLIKIYGKKCFNCPKIINLQLDHIIPICFGGDEFSKENHQILCYSCHIEKTRIERRTIGIAKKIGFISGSRKWFSYLDSKERIKWCLKIQSEIKVAERWKSQ